MGRTLTFGYDLLGMLTSVGDGTRTVSYSYTGGCLTGATDAGGHNWTYLYDPGPVPALLTGVTETLGNTPLTQSYDPLGRVAMQTLCVIFQRHAPVAQTDSAAVDQPPLSPAEPLVEVPLEPPRTRMLIASAVTKVREGTTVSS